MCYLGGLTKCDGRKVSVLMNFGLFAIFMIARHFYQQEFVSPSAGLLLP